MKWKGWDRRGKLCSRWFRRFLSFGVIIAFISSSVSYAHAGPLKRPLSFQQITQKEGLSSEMVNAIAVQGEEVWFGTEGGGATLYDRAKKTWKAYTTKGDPQDKDDGVSIRWKNILPHNHVSVILPDEDRVWFGTYFYGFGGGGISYYQARRTPVWKTFNTNNGQAKKIVSMAADPDTLWVGSEKGLSLLDKKKEAWKGFLSAQGGLTGNFVNALLLQSEYLWVGTNAGISRLHKTKKIWKKYTAKEGFPEREMKSLVRVGQKVWAGSADGLLLEYDPDLDRWKQLDSTDPLKNGGVYSMLATKDWVFVCRDNGVSACYLPTGQWESITASDGLLSNNIFCAAEDGNSIWFGTDKGASRLVFSP